ncbi:hypothetical protein F4X86_04135 [Candidatus Saccharibacteria bacterium]|nr:hypothetical protein [Candidatus Saccharibacteria bacterium]
MAVLLIAGIILLISMMGGDRNESASDSDETAESEQAGEREETRNEQGEIRTDAGTPPMAPAAPSLPAGVESEDVHTGSFGDILPLLPIAQADYVFLDGYTLDYGGCWSASYDIAYKGQWDDRSLDTVFEDDRMLATVERELPKLYPGENMEEFQIFILVYQYDGGESASDYKDVDYEDSKLYIDGDLAGCNT